MSKSIWHITNQNGKPTDIPEKENFIILDGVLGNSGLWYGGEEPIIFWENVKRWCYLDELILENERTRKALEIIKKEMSKETMPDFAVIHNALKNSTGTKGLKKMATREILETPEEKLEEFRLKWILNDIDFWVRKYIGEQINEPNFCEWTDEDSRAIKTFGNYLYKRIKSIKEGETLQTREDLDNLLNNPLFWRDGSPAIIARIRKGFEKLNKKGIEQ